MILIINREELKGFMAAIDNLTQALTDQTTAINDLTAAVATIPPQPGTGGATEAQVQAAADQTNANNAAIAKQTAAVKAAVTPAPSS